MAEKSGAGAYIYFKGTDISGNFREISYSDEIGLVDASAGADAAETYIATLLKGGLKYKAVWQDTAAGDAAWLLLVPGANGSLILGPNGSTAGYPKITVNAISKKRGDLKIKYNDVMEFDEELVFSGAPTPGTF